RQSNRAVRIGRCAATAHAGKRNAIERADGNRYVWPLSGEDRCIPVLDNWIQTVYVSIRYFRVFIRLPVTAASQVRLARRRHLAQWWRSIVMIRGANPDRGATGITCSLRQRFRAERTTNRKHREQNADQTQEVREKT